MEIHRQYYFPCARGINKKLLFSSKSFDSEKTINPALFEAIRRCFVDGANFANLSQLRQQFLAVDEADRVEIYQSIVEHLKIGTVQDSPEVVLMRYENIDQFSVRYVPTEVRFINDFIENINPILACLENALEIEEGQGYRFTWAREKQAILAGVAKDYQHKGTKVREYLSLDHAILPSNFSGTEIIEGFVDGERIILLCAPDRNGEVTQYQSLFRAAHLHGPFQQELAQLLNILAQISPDFRSGPITMDIYYPLAVEILREHELGHTISDPVCPGLESRLLEDLNLQNIFILCSLSEILADVLGPLTLIEETAKTDKVKAEKLFWTFLFKKLMYAIPKDGIDPFDGRFNKEFILRLLVSLIFITFTNGKPTYAFNPFRLSALKRQTLEAAQASFQLWLSQNQAQTAGTAIDERIKFDMLKVVNPRQQFGQICLNFSQEIIWELERIFNMR